MNHTCPASGCTAEVSPYMLMCRTHWYMVPYQLRRSVWLEWDEGMGAGTDGHNAAIRAAVEAVNAKLGA